MIWRWLERVRGIFAKQPQVSQELPMTEERKQTLAWLAENGQKIADAMFRDASLFYEEDLEKKRLN